MNHRPPDFAQVGAPADVPGLTFALDRGVDALVLDADASPELCEAALIAKAQRAESAAGDDDAAAARDAPAGPATLEAWDVVAVSDGGCADRVAVDFTTLLSHDEGLLVGSSAKALALVLGETATGGFVPPRPFRVNAGPVHAYALAADLSTKYLSEVGAGDHLLIVGRDGSTREGVVGRAKVLSPRGYSADGSRRRRGRGRGYSVEASRGGAAGRGYSVEASRGGAVAGDVDIPW